MPTNTWDSSVPAGSRLRSLGDDDIRQLKLDIRERLAAEHVSGDGTAIEAADFTEARHKLSSIGLLGLLKGLRIEQRSYATSGNITVSGKLQIEINGDMCYLNSDTNLAFSGLTASTSYYIYVASPGHETEIVAGNLSYSTTAPTYSTAKKGWYNGTSRAIGFFRVFSDSKMLPFVQTSNFYKYLIIGEPQTDIANILSAGTSTTYVELTSVANYIPIFAGNSAIFTFYITTNTNGNLIHALFSADGTYCCAALYLNVNSVSTTLRQSMTTECLLSLNRTIYYKAGNLNTVVYVYNVGGFNIDGSL